MVALLINLLKSNVKFAWGSDGQHAFDNVKSLLCSAPVLAAPQLDKPFKLQVDASQVGAASVGRPWFEQACLVFFTHLLIH